MANEAAESEGARTGRKWQLPKPNEVTIGGAAFLLSLTIAAATFTQTLLGPEIDFIPPEQILLYRGGRPGGAVLYAAIRLPVVNRSSAYNDVVVSSTLQLSDGDPALPYFSLVTPVFNDESEPEKSRGHCVQGRRCHAFRKMAISELGDDVILIPAGGAHAHYYAFRMLCRGGEKSCSKYSDFDQALDALRGRPLEFEFRMKLYSDGERTITCPVEQINAEHIRKVGWQSLDCKSPVAHGGPLF
jgi:hypothetical protein